MFQKKKTKVQGEVVILSLDQNQEPVDLQNGVATIGGNGGFQIKWADGVPDPNTDPEGFKDYLHKWHLKNNPTHFK